MTSMLTRVVTLFTGRFVAKDEYGNRYYEKRQRTGRVRRWVVYAHQVDASRVPAAWHGWLHYGESEIPSQWAAPHTPSWVKPHLPNRTGTVERYLPRGHILSRRQRQKATGDYRAWTPPQE